MFKAYIKRIIETGYSKKDIVYHTFGKINTRDEALKRVYTAFKRLKLNLEGYEVIIYESEI